MASWGQSRSESAGIWARATARAAACRAFCNRTWYESPLGQTVPESFLCDSSQAARFSLILTNLCDAEFLETVTSMSRSLRSIALQSKCQSSASGRRPAKRPIAIAGTKSEEAAAKSAPASAVERIPGLTDLTLAD